MDVTTHIAWSFCNIYINIKSLCCVPVINIVLYVKCYRASLIAQVVKNLPAMQETWVQSLDWEDPLDKRMATHSSILAWRIPRTTAHGVAKTQTRLSDFIFTNLTK